MIYIYFSYLQNKLLVLPWISMGGVSVMTLFLKIIFLVFLCCAFTNRKCPPTRTSTVHATLFYVAPVLLLRNSLSCYSVTNRTRNANVFNHSNFSPRLCVH
uniref:Uncharacterized protein n=1 Tax=Anguilla anguilla TaxID=7936 RepID=A0A0E9WTJ0_ANGAN